MRILFKLAVKLAFMAILVVVISGGVRYAMQKFMPGAGVAGTIPGAGPVSAEESGLMSTVFGSALRLLSGSASRDELASDLSKKLYGERADAQTMSELGIELVKPTGETLDLADQAGKAAPNLASASAPATGRTESPFSISSATNAGGGAAGAGTSSAGADASNPATGRLALLWARIKVCSVELTVIPVVLLGMFIRHRRRRRALACDFVPSSVLIPHASDSEPYEMKHAVHALGSEEFELLVALIYQRQGYRVSMPAGLGGGRGGDFKLQRKGERVLVQCKKLNTDHKVPVERVRELHETMLTANIARGMYVASCGYTWDARNYAKKNGITVINARTLDELIIAARANPAEDLLAVDSWLPGLISRIEFTTPVCPACESPMDEVTTSHNTVWVCRHRPDCRGRRCGRKFRKLPAPEKSDAACEAAA